MSNRRMWIVAGVLMLAVVAVSAHLTTTTEEYSRYNIQWNGTSGCVERFIKSGAVEVHETASLEGHRNALLVIIAPAGSYTPAEIERYRAFLEQGNSILLADDDGSGNQLLGELGSSIRLVPGNVSGAERSYTDPGAVTGRRCSDHPLLTNCTALQFNHPGTVTGGTALIRTSPLSWIDQNGNGRIDPGEPQGGYTLCSRENAGSGEIIVLADPSIFINAMLAIDGEVDNARFLRQVTGAYPSVLLDQTRSRTASGGDVIDGISAVRSSPWRVLIAGLVVLPAIIIFGRRKTEESDNA
ncbi:DUF4350 domain-containing protein [Methanoculleus sp. FWC-SCC1]|uniref:DUF4350 domain-containing protein n=1 Tax=Methanoculleus frigidifontis TaxID=2584085 RepID=A0ABT8MBM7_9EURY|nr:DUF4350 domain-containing protein [Methanoculleus sp. FWC-SCC1]MDN7025344.1 DUF4350 domain-containing protein [Methanoculleus sp. FWC-SCC1]